MYLVTRVAFYNLTSVSSIKNTNKSQKHYPTNDVLCLENLEFGEKRQCSMYPETGNEKYIPIGAYTQEPIYSFYIRFNNNSFELNKSFRLNQ